MLPQQKYTVFTSQNADIPIENCVTGVIDKSTSLHRRKKLVYWDWLVYSLLKTIWLWTSCCWNYTTMRWTDGHDDTYYYLVPVHKFSTDKMYRVWLLKC